MGGVHVIVVVVVVVGGGGVVVYLVLSLQLVPLWLWGCYWSSWY